MKKIKIINGNIVTYKVYIDKETEDLRLKAIIYYRYNIFNIKRIDLDEVLTEDTTVKTVFSAIKTIINNLDKLTKL